MPTPKKTITKAIVKKTPAAKRAVVKKITQKKVQPKAKKDVTSLKPLVIADNARSFWVADGKILNSLVALQTALAEMEVAVYAHHVSKEKNDFATWVDSVLCDQTCAAALTKAKTPTAAKTVVVQHLKSYNF